MNRREFLNWMGAGSASVLLGTQAWGDWLNQQGDASELQRWRAELVQPARPRIYQSDRHTDARLHLGGIGTGNFEIGADGQCTTWQLFNTLRDGNLPFHFALQWRGQACLLQTTGGPGWPCVKRIEMTGEYPMAILRFVDERLPVQMELTAFTPFAPLETKLSSLPAAFFIFRIHNPAGEACVVSLGAFLQNAIGYDARGQIQGNRHPNFGANYMERMRIEGGSAVLLKAKPAAAGQLEQPVCISIRPNLRGLLEPPNDRPANLAIQLTEDVRALPQVKDGAAAKTAIWWEDIEQNIPEQLLANAREAVQAGATLVFSGGEAPLLKFHAEATGGEPPAKTAPRPDIVFADFENGYGPWKVEGAAFGAHPATGTLPNQQWVSGFLGKGLVNTYLNGDDTTGRLVSPEFKIERHYIRFLAGGGDQQTTQIRLIIDGRKVRAAAGRNEEKLLPGAWDVREFAGQNARLEIVDEQTGPWGHINIDQIEFSDLPANQAVLFVLDDLLPARFRRIRPVEASGSAPARLEFEGLQLKPNAQSTVLGNGRKAIVCSYGQGKVILADGAILAPAQSELVGARQRAYATVCELLGVRYESGPGVPANAPGFGQMGLAVLGGQASARLAFHDWAAAWDEFQQHGRFAAEAGGSSAPTPPGQTANTALASQVSVPAGQTVEVPFLLTWHFPNKYNGAGAWMGCHYATVWPDCAGVLQDAARNSDHYRKLTEKFRRTFYDSTLPYWLLDCVSSQASIIRHIGVVFRIANGDVYGWEGSNGCCQPTCTHVWGYEQTLARLFPDLERDMRRIDFQHQQRADGGVNNRTEVPSPPHPTGEQPFADGHASCILKAWREALNHPDEAWMREYWPAVKRGVEYLVGRDAARNGGQPRGILEDDQWNTYDEALHGVTTFISGYYLAALRAGEEWARRLGDTATASRFHGIFEAGQKKLVELCWNGEYFQQHLPDYLKRSGEVGPGCMSDQLIGQWWAHQLGLGYLLPKDLVRTALRSVFKYNWVPDLTNWKHMPRAFAGARDKGLLICTWPKGGRPAGVMLYSDEVWTGIEYQVASHLIYEGMVEEGLAIIKGARDRYDGIPRPPMGRNPWNEIECGGHYARAMSSWSLLTALTGCEYDAPAGLLAFAPKHFVADQCQAFFCVADSWGVFHHQQNPLAVEIRVEHGRLAISQLALGMPLKPGSVTVTVSNAQNPVKITVEPNGTGCKIQFEVPVVLHQGEKMAVTNGQS